MKTDKLIACCGLDCSACEARIATLNNDNELRAQTAEKWKTQHGALDITAEMINCTGCREAGVKIGHCEKCDIRNCAFSKGFKTCSECDKLESCPTLGHVLKFVPEALSNLKNLN
jgi:hypothetical protein